MTLSRLRGDCDRNPKTSGPLGRPPWAHCAGPQRVPGPSRGLETEARRREVSQDKAEAGARVPECPAGTDEVRAPAFPGDSPSSLPTPEATAARPGPPWSHLMSPPATGLPRSSSTRNSPRCSVRQIRAAGSRRAHSMLGAVVLVRWASAAWKTEVQE